MSTDVIARLAAANPVPTGAAPPVIEPLRVPRRRVAVALVLAAAVAVPAAAFAGKLGDLFGLSNQGTPVATTSLYLSQDTQMSAAMQSLGFPTTLQLLGTQNGVSFYASRRADGHYCFALEKDGNRGGVSCDLDGSFPSPSDPVWAFPPHDTLAGFAADGVATIVGIDASGQRVVTVPVQDNLFAAPDGDYTGVATIAAFDARGTLLWSWRLPDR